VDCVDFESRNQMNAVHFSSNKDEWETPPEIFDPLDAEFDFDLDPCADARNRKCQLYLGKETDGLSQNWSECVSKSGWGSAFINPPYSSLKAWIAKCSEESKKGMTCVMLIPSRTDTRAWHSYIYDAKLWRFRPGVEVRFLPGRVTFWENGKPAVNKKTGKPQCAPFPSCIVIFRPT
jgi:phage N-6-adenine-methyltransferase